MIRYKSSKQITIQEFKTPFEVKLDKENRWVKLAGMIPWDELAMIYYKNLSKNKGAPTIDARIVIGALIVKHRLRLDDRETIETIRENMYIQYFLGLTEYTYDDIFDRSLFTLLRYRIGIEQFDAMSCELINRAEKPKPGQKKEKKAENKSEENQQEKESEHQQEQEPQKNQGKLLLDATVADQMIVYPTDLGLVAKSRQESERIIDLLCLKLEVKTKPRTYRRKAHKQYLAIAKQRHKTKKQIRKALGQQLRYLQRNIKSIDALLDTVTSGSIPLEYHDLRIMWVIRHIYDQQMQMYKGHTHSIEHRIVNIYQPYVRPIVRGKDNAQVEFGAKLGVSLLNGFCRLNNLSWDAYNESKDLKNQAEKYKELKGYYPETIIADTIYGTRENRKWLKERNIRFSGRVLGRPPKESLSPYQKRKKRQEQGMRNQIEGKFGQGKNAYNLSRVRTRTARTSESWIACILFMMNLIKFSQVFLCFFKNWIKNFIRIISLDFLEQNHLQVVKCYS